MEMQEAKSFQEYFVGPQLPFQSMCINNLRPDKCVGNLKLAVSKINYF